MYGISDKQWNHPRKKRKIYVWCKKCNEYYDTGKTYKP